jgi:hypothetical protein
LYPPNQQDYRIDDWMETQKINVPLNQEEQEVLNDMEISLEDVLTLEENVLKLKKLKV